MQKRSSIKDDGSATAYVEKNPAAVALGKLGGAKGGKARAEKLTAEERSSIARKAAVARWGDPERKRNANKTRP